jgi:tetratricopeptide (TPR) repeat protein
VLAFHAEQAALLASEVDSDFSLALGRRAFDLLLEAAERAWKRDDNYAATNLYDRCVRIASMIDASPNERLQVNGMTALLHWLHEGESWMPRVDALIEDGRRVGPSETLALLLMHRGIADLGRDLDAARAHFAEALSVARATGDPDIISQVWWASWLPAVWVGDLDAAEGVQVEAGEFDRANGLVRRRALWPVRSAERMLWRGQFSAAAVDLKEAGPLVEASRSKFQRQRRLQVMARLATGLGDHEKAIAYGTECLGVNEEIGLADPIGTICWRLGEAFVLAADYERASSTIERGLEWFGPNNRGARPEMLAYLAQASLGLGHVSAARSHVEEAEAIVLPYDVEALAVVWTAAAMVAARIGDSVGAEARFREAIDGIAKTQFDLFTALTRLAFARFLLEQKRAAEARDQLAAARSFFSDPLAFRRRDEIDALLRQCAAVRALG